VIGRVRAASRESRAILSRVAHHRYRLTLEGELSDSAAAAFTGMTIMRTEDVTTLVGPVRDQSELQGILQRVSDLGLTLLSATALDAAPRR
jgi:hypothetical protein